MCFIKQDAISESKIHHPAVLSLLHLIVVFSKHGAVLACELGIRLILPMEITQFEQVHAWSSTVKYHYSRNDIAQTMA